MLQIDCQESDPRLDGELRANTRIASPAVAVAVQSTKGSLLFTCGKYPTWQHNVRAIALGLEALRRVERYGIVQSDEQYRGCLGIPPAAVNREDLAAACRAAARKHHPDHGGDPETLRRITEARNLLVAS